MTVRGAADFGKTPMTARRSSPRLQARIAGFLYMIVVAASIFALTTSSSLIVRGDAAATAANILASEASFRLGFAANLIAGAAYIGVVALLYGVFKPVSRTMSFVAAFFGLAGCAISAMNMANQIAPLFFLGDAAYLAAFDADQRHALAYVSLRLLGLGNDIGLVFFGFYCLLIGCLVLGSTFLPRLLGVVMVIAGLGWLTSSFATFIAPALGNTLSSYLLPISGLGETLFTLWLLIMGVNAKKWREQAGESAGAVS